jgi:hypothetical protein
MTYLDKHALGLNLEFQNRITAASTEQAMIFVNDDRPEFVAPSQRIILASGNAAPLFPLVANQPGMSVESPDADILAAVQAVWPVYGAALVEAVPPEVEDA